MWRAWPTGGTMEEGRERRLDRDRVQAWRGPSAEEVVRVQVSPEAEEFVRGHGGQLWVWVSRPWACCWGTPAMMNAATAPPPRVSGFSPVHAEGLDVWFRIPSGRLPEVLEIGMRGKRRPRVEAYWDGCTYAL